MTEPAMPGRVLADTDYLALKMAVRQLVKRCGGQESAASITRSNHQLLSRFGLPDQPTHAPIDVIADLERDAGSAPVTTALADLAGCILVPKPPAEGDARWVAALGALAREVGDVIGKLGEALADDQRITAQEIIDQKLREEVRQALEVLARIDKGLVAILEAESR